MTKPHRDRSPSDPLAVGLTVYNEADAALLGNVAKPCRVPLSCRRQGLNQPPARRYRGRERQTAGAQR